MTDYDAALIIWKSIAVENPDAVAPKLRQVLDKKGDNKTAIGTWKEILMKNPDIAMAQAELAKAYKSNGDLMVEIAGWNELVCHFPNAQGLKSELTRAQQEQNQHLLFLCMIFFFLFVAVSKIGT